MRSPGSTVEDVFKRTRMDVLRGSNSKQAPLVLIHRGRGIHFFPGGAGENRPRAARGQASGFASAGPGKAGIDARRQNRDPGPPATAPKPVTPANPDAARDESIRQLDARI